MYITIKKYSWKKVVSCTLHKKCPYSELFWSAFFPHFSAFGPNTPYLSVFSPNARKCGKNADQNNSEHGHFLRSGNCKSSHFTRFPGCSNPWKMFVRLFSLANFKTSFLSQAFFKISQHEYSRKKFVELTDTPLQTF